MTDDLNQPLPHQVEVSVFGPGYGEAIAAHCGLGKWFLVDSCVPPGSVAPVSLQYLASIGVEPATAVELVAVTHWHDDHVRGISEIFDACQNAKFSFSGALRHEEFLTLASTYAGQAIPEGSGVDEIGGILRSLDRRKESGQQFISPTIAHQDRTLLQDELAIDGTTVPVEIVALSPSDSAEIQANTSFAQLIPEPGKDDKKVRIAPPSRNMTSVVILVRIGEVNILLGSDLELTEDPTMGWLAILNGSNVFTSRAEVFKVPHHGSENAHCDELWEQKLTTDPYSLLSPWMRGGNFIPRSDDIARIKNLTPNFYMTSLPKKAKWKPRDRVVEEMVKTSTRSISELELGSGHIRLRQDIRNPDSEWTVELFGAARHMG